MMTDADDMLMDKAAQGKPRDTTNAGDQKRRKKLEPTDERRYDPHWELGAGQRSSQQEEGYAVAYKDVRERLAGLGHTKENIDAYSGELDKEKRFHEDVDQGRAFSMEELFALPSILGLGLTHSALL